VVVPGQNPLSALAQRAGRLALRGTGRKSPGEC
jgi:hypothetical protein